MAKKFFRAQIRGRSYRVFFSDLALICKRSKKARPTLPSYEAERVTVWESDLNDTEEDRAEPKHVFDC